jgi:hypothetical protein
MAKFSGTQVLQRPKAAVKTTTTRRRTAEGALGYERDAKSELFLLAISNMVGENTFYEKAKDRDQRFQSLIRQVVREDPEWVARFIPYLRNTMQMRSASTVMAVEYGLALDGVDRDTLKQNQYPRHVVASSMSRADEPAEAIGYYFSAYGKNLPMWLKRGISDATHRLYTERSALKYDGIDRDIRMADVIELTHAKPRDSTQSKLFKFLLDRRHNREIVSVSQLETIQRALALTSMPVKQRREWLVSDEFDPELLELAGFTWERLSGWLQGPMDKVAWEAIIPSMGYMAILRNLRNFEEAGISPAMVKFVNDKLQDPEEVKRSRQFPIRFYSAFKATDSLKWASALQAGLEASLVNVPYLKGRSLILIDTSGSMGGSISEKSKVERYELAGLFGVSAAHRCERADTYTYSNGPTPLHVGNSSLLDMVKVVAQRTGGGTDTFGSLDRTYKGQDRVIILTDEQAHPAYFGGGGGYWGSNGWSDPRPVTDKVKCPIYTFNVAGYKTAQLDNGAAGRYAFGGLTDAGFKMIDLLEKYRAGVWPWMKD